MPELLRWKEELNVFVFREEPGQPVKKTWFYVKPGGAAFDSVHRELTIHAYSQITYVPDEFGI